jgi:hypothetical protein
LSSNPSTAKTKQTKATRKNKELILKSSAVRNRAERIHERKGEGERGEDQEKVSWRMAFILGDSNKSVPKV